MSHEGTPSYSNPNNSYESGSATIERDVPDTVTKGLAAHSLKETVELIDREENHPEHEPEPRSNQPKQEDYFDFDIDFTGPTIEPNPTDNSTGQAALEMLFPITVVPADELVA